MEIGISESRGTRDLGRFANVILENEEIRNRLRISSFSGITFVNLPKSRVPRFSFGSFIVTPLYY